MHQTAGLCEPNAFRQTFKPRALFRARKHTLSRRGVAYVNCAQRRPSDNATIRVPSDPNAGSRQEGLTGVAAGGGVNRGDVRIPQCVH
jgi:hypothetical protein